MSKAWTEHATLALGLMLLLSAQPGAADPAESRRELDLPLERYEPHVRGDLRLSGTYPLWRDRSRLDWRLAGSPEEHWKLNWKFMDPPYNSAVHGGHFALDRGEALYRQLDRSGRFAACLGATRGRLKGLRTRYPRYRADLGRVVGLEEAIEHCAAAQGQVLENGSYDNSAVSLYIASLSQGLPIAIDVSRGPMRAAFERGRRLFHTRAGRLNFACSSCHVRNVGQMLRGSHITTPYGDVAHYPVYRTQYMLQSLHLRLIECNLDAGVQPLRPGSRAYTDLEVFLTALSNGYPVSVPAERH
ncbi:MAG: sulfur oxidation c-type cytochrome SoxA [Thiobacillaceae bacterium]|nr:sulfur oxidation c-type cytochrome SoxA [Thiobacillaceae bacterium]